MYALNEIWDDCLSIVLFGFAVEVKEVQVFLLKAGGQSLHRNERFVSILINLVLKINQTIITIKPGIFAALSGRVLSWTARPCCRCLLRAALGETENWFIIPQWGNFCFDDTFGVATLAVGVARLGVVALHVKACLRCAFIGFLPELWHRVGRRWTERASRSQTPERTSLQ